MKYVVAIANVILVCHWKMTAWQHLLLEILHVSKNQRSVLKVVWSPLSSSPSPQLYALLLLWLPLWIDRQGGFWRESANKDQNETSGIDACIE